MKTSVCGELKLKFWCGNQVDSTWAVGSASSANLPGCLWKIEEAYIADGGRQPGGIGPIERSRPLLRLLLS
ncbi:hypothetical protein [Paenibacillus sp. Soil522]|uniref:hypothetical protein n=1 Tax=Paenibacillus sp. Soil522 TaxID=1736388 RepID=UPI000A5459D0|nr:hypothetical protein [Paenibacillus sp. Soil522]